MIWINEYRHDIMALCNDSIMSSNFKWHLCVLLSLLSFSWHPMHFNMEPMEPWNPKTGLYYWKWPLCDTYMGKYMILINYVHLLLVELRVGTNVSNFRAAHRQRMASISRAEAGQSRTTSPELKRKFKWKQLRNTYPRTKARWSLGKVAELL